MSRIDDAGYWRDGNGHSWRVPYGVRAAFGNTLTFSQIASEYPFYVQWRHPSKNGGPPRTLTRSCSSLGAACAFIVAHLTDVDPEAFIVCRLGFYIPSPLLGKFPRRMGPQQKMHYWCPRCMAPRVFRRTSGDQWFYANKKILTTDRHGNPDYQWKNVRLALIECTRCGLNNRDNKFRASNQPVTKVKVRATRRARTTRRRRR